MDCAGTHLILDLWGCRGLDELPRVERALREAAAAAGATLLRVDLHGFGAEKGQAADGGGGGVTGVAMLAESHVTVHTWPEHGYAACDVFLCGTGVHADAAADALVRCLEAERYDLRRVERGRR